MLGVIIGCQFGGLEITQVTLANYSVFLDVDLVLVEILLYLGLVMLNRLIERRYPWLPQFYINLIKTLNKSHHVEILGIEPVEERLILVRIALAIFEHVISQVEIFGNLIDLERCLLT